MDSYTCIYFNVSICLNEINKTGFAGQIYIALINKSHRAMVSRM